MEKRDYEDAIAMLDACNLCGVVQTFADVLSRLNAESREKGEDTDWVNEHPLSKVFALKIADLAKVNSNENMGVLALIHHNATFGENFQSH